MTLKIIREDILNVKATAIVNPTDVFLSGSGNIDKRIHSACGSLLEEELKQIDSFNISEAVITKAYDFHNCKYVIHVAGPIYVDGQQNEYELLRQAYGNTLSVAKENNIDSIAIPLISTGTFKFPKKTAFNIATEEINEFLSENEMNITLVVYDEESFSVSKQLSTDVKDYIIKKFDTYQAHQNIGLIDKLENTIFKKDMKTASYSITPESEDEEEAYFESSPISPAIGIKEAKPHFELDESFSEALLRVIDEKGLKDSQVYKKAGIDRKLFSTIRSNKNYRPSKKTAVSLCVALELSLTKTNWLLKKAGLALSDGNLFDVIIEYFIKNKNYDIYEINVVLLDNDQPLIGI